MPTNNSTPYHFRQYIAKPSASFTTHTLTPPLMRLRHIFLYVYIFTLGFENWSPYGNPTDLFRPTLIAAFLYLLLSFLNYRECFSLVHCRHLVLPSLILWIWFSVLSIIKAMIDPSLEPSINYAFLGCIISFWLLANDIQNAPFLKSRFIYLSISSGALLSILLLFNLGTEIGFMGRITILGNNPNLVALSFVLSLLFILFLLLDNPLGLSGKRYLLLLLIPLLLQGISKSGSKGSMILFIVGLLCYFLSLKRKPTTKVLTLYIGAMVLFGAYHYILQNNIMAKRWSTFISEGDTSERLARWNFAADIIANNFMFGVGENGYRHYTRSLVGADYDPHNVYLYVMAVGGITGFGIFALFLLRLAKQCYATYQSSRYAFSLVILIILLMHWFKAGGGLESKLVWAYIAFISFPILRRGNFTRQHTALRKFRYIRQLF